MFKPGIFVDLANRYVICKSETKLVIMKKFWIVLGLAGILTIGLSSCTTSRGGCKVSSGMVGY